MSRPPARQLWVLRHAKAAPHDAADHDRPLTGRGRRQCAELAAHLAGRAAGALPPLVLVSSATRARQTAELLLGALEALGAPAAPADAPRVEIEPALYQADVEDVLELVGQVDEELPSVMVVGHNPTLEELVWVLVGGDDGRGQLRGLSTGALAVIGGPRWHDWAALKPGTGRLRSLYTPTAR